MFAHQNRTRTIVRIIENTILQLTQTSFTVNRENLAFNRHLLSEALLTQYLYRTVVLFLFKNCTGFIVDHDT